MEPNIAVISKKVWNIVRVAIYMIKKGVCKKKIFMDLNMMMKRGKIAGKALRNLMFHHHHHHHKVDNHHHFSATPSCVGGPTKDSEDVPLERHTHNVSKKRKNISHHRKTSTQFYTPLPYFMQDGEKIDLEEVHNMVEMVLRNEEVTTTTTTGATTTASPAMPGLGFGRNPVVRQLRVTDSPFPLQNSDDNKQVDQAADAFIKRFYSHLKQQNYC